MDVSSLLATAAVAGVGAYFGSYVREKRKNLATREDVDRLATRTEEIKASISGDLWLGQSRWAFKRDVYTQLLAAVNAATMELRTLVALSDMIDQAQSESEKSFPRQQLGAVQLQTITAVKSVAAMKALAAVVVGDEALKAIERFDAAGKRLRPSHEQRSRGTRLTPDTARSTC